MSETEFHTGKLKLIFTDGYQTIEHFCQQMCRNNGRNNLDGGNNSWKEQFKDEFRKKYFVYNNNAIYEFIEHIEEEYGDSYMNIYPNADGTLSFIGSFYNGGTYLEEILAEALDKLNE